MCIHVFPRPINERPECKCVSVWVWVFEKDVKQTKHETSNNFHAAKCLVLPDMQRGHHANTSPSLTCGKRVSLDTIHLRTSLASHWNCLSKTIYNTILSLSHSSSLCFPSVIGQSWASTQSLALSGHISKLFWMEHQTCGQLTSTPPHHSYPNHCTVVARGWIPLLVKTLVLRNTGLEFSIKTAWDDCFKHHEFNAKLTHQFGITQSGAVHT